MNQTVAVVLAVSAFAAWWTWYGCRWWYSDRIETAEEAAEAVTKENVALRVALDACAITAEAQVIRDETLRVLDKKLVSMW